MGSNLLRNPSKITQITLRFETKIYLNFSFSEGHFFRKIWIIQTKERIPPEIHIAPAPNRRAYGRMTKLPWIRSKAIPKTIIERVPATIFQSGVNFDPNIISTISDEANQNIILVQERSNSIFDFSSNSISYSNWNC